MQYGDFFYWQIDQNDDGIYDEIWIGDCDESVVSVEIPDEIDGVPVTQIEYGAFQGCESLESITIPDSVTSIGGSAFSGTPLINNQTTDIKYADKWVVECDTDVTSAEIKEGTRGIAEWAFEYCTSLESITIPGSVTKIGYVSFQGCESLTNITIPSSVQEIGPYAFAKCTNLETVVIENGAETIGGGAFSGCSNLTNVNIPESVKFVGSKVFSETAFLKNQAGPIYYADDWVIGSDTEIENIEIKEGIKGIAHDSFARCKNLKSVSIPDGITVIGDFAFAGCENIAEVTVPESVNVIGLRAFCECSSLKQIVIENPLCEIGEWHFLGVSYSYSSDPQFTICNYIEEYGASPLDDKAFFNGTIYGYENSTAQEYAENYGYKFESIGVYTPEVLKGDADGNGKIAASDAAFIAKLIAKASLIGAKVSVTEYPSADYNGDGKISAQDAALIAKYVAEQALKK